ncbi:hypothetical protein SAMN05518848_112132 [Paenibacillus sp. PDC88]|nr:hypothetical protein [Paenibacillus sp. MER 78]SDX72374.1 hypothetical protein SAMN05518848_112132 [Paenibacillus sp. PDC88]SFS89278.1 hypothetical protein SAMN04488601_106128 [Paenibacillus sp. 453mf]
MLRIQRRVVEMKYTDSVESYDDTVEEVYEIREVRDWVYSIFRLFPHFIYFISMEFDSHLTVLACLGDVETIRLGSYPLTPNENKKLGIDIVQEAPRAL